MKKTSGKERFKWIQTKVFYGVVLSLILAITGIATAIYNVAKVKQKELNPPHFTVFPILQLRSNSHRQMQT